MAAPLTLQCSLSSDVVSPLEASRPLYLLAEIGGGEGAQALPSNLVFVLDVSDSMRIYMVEGRQFSKLVKKGKVTEDISDGIPIYRLDPAFRELAEKFPRRIDYVVRALEEAVDYIQPADYFSVVTFASYAYSPVQSSPGSERNRLRHAARQLDHLHQGDGTYLDRGLEEAFIQLQQRDTPHHAARIIVLTDGHTQNVKECYAWAERFRQEGYRLTTMGIGAEFNEDLLIPLADMTGGNAYYIESPDKIPKAFQAELGAAKRVSYRNVELKLGLAGGVELRGVHRVRPELGEFDVGAEMENSYALILGDFDPAAPLSLLIELALPPWQEGAYRLAQALLSWEDPAQQPPRQNLRQDIVVRCTPQANPRYNERVMNIVEKVTAYRMSSEALQAALEASRNADPEQRKQATLRLRQAATRLIDMGEKALAENILQQAKILEAKGQLDAQATKKLRYETRRLGQHS